jgi:predicted transcriptional regulator
MKDMISELLTLGYSVETIAVLMRITPVTVQKYLRDK